MNFEELGLTLQREREKKGLSIEMVMEATKISRTNIVAMENGDKATLPHPVYAKGFIKSYARFLGLDADELSMIVDREYQDEADGPEERVYEVSPAAEKAFQEGDSPEIGKKSVWPLLLVLVLVVGIVVLLVMNFNGNNGEEKVETKAPAEQVEETAPPAPPAPEPTAEEAAESSAGEAPAVGESAQPVQEESKEETAAENAAPEAAPEKPAVKPEVKPEPKPEHKVVAAPEKKEPATESEKQVFEHMLVIRATTEKGCWIGLWKGDEADMARDFVLKEGEPLRLKFNTPRRIRIGNVAGVSVMYNGKPYPLDSAKGNIQTLRFGME